MPELEENPRDCVNDSEDTYAKQQLNANVSGKGSKLLGLKWDKIADTLAITFPQERAEPTKREILGKLARIYDPRVQPCTQLLDKTLEQHKGWWLQKRASLNRD